MIHWEIGGAPGCDGDSDWALWVVVLIRADADCSLFPDARTRLTLLTNNTSTREQLANINRDPTQPGNCSKHRRSSGLEPTGILNKMGSTVKGLKNGASVSAGTHTPQITLNTLVRSDKLNQNVS